MNEWMANLEYADAAAAIAPSHTTPLTTTQRRRANSIKRRDLQPQTRAHIGPETLQLLQLQPDIYGHRGGGGIGGGNMVRGGDRNENLRLRQSSLDLDLGLDDLRRRRTSRFDPTSSSNPYSGAAPLSLSGDEESSGFESAGAGVGSPRTASSRRRKRITPQGRMTSASLSRSSLSTSNNKASSSSSRHNGHGHEHSHHGRSSTRHRKSSSSTSGRPRSRSRSVTSTAMTSTGRRRKSTIIAKEEVVDEAPVYVYGPPPQVSREQRRTAPTRISEVRTLGRNNDDKSDESSLSLSSEEEENNESMSVISEEPEGRAEPEEKPKVRVVYIKAERPKSIPPRSSSARRRPPADDAHHESKESSTRRASAVKTVHRSHTTSSRWTTTTVSPIEKLKRTLSGHDSSFDAKPSLRRSHTNSSSNTTGKPLYETSVHNTSSNGKRPNFLGLGMFSSPPKPVEPPRLVECTACLSDDIPHIKTAKLKCGHRMCHSCLKRVFKLSISDPQHMPPKCCTAEHIPLKHVDKLFNNDFKMQWNKKFQEYTTKNRIYCPARRCGEWIKPANIHVENGRKVGKCSACKTKVCCLCNGKWHGNKDCPKDEETNQLLETAKKAGWQRCYNCRSMVELKEGCNHMTFRCTAEFCMICGAKWKSCNCPWFNYETVEQDRLRHMRIAAGGNNNPNNNNNVFDHLAAPRRPPRAYNEEMNARRQQELQDEDLARRLQVLGVDDDDVFEAEDWGQVLGIGNAAGHFMNEWYGGPRARQQRRYVVNIPRRGRAVALGDEQQDFTRLRSRRMMRDEQIMALPAGGRVPPAAEADAETADHANRAPQDLHHQEENTAANPEAEPEQATEAIILTAASRSIPRLRPHDPLAVAYNALSSTRPSERVVTRRYRTDYAAERARHAPLSAAAAAAGAAMARERDRDARQRRTSMRMGSVSRRESQLRQDGGDDERQVQVQGWEAGGQSRERSESPTRRRSVAVIVRRGGEEIRRESRDMDAVQTPAREPQDEKGTSSSATTEELPSTETAISAPPSPLPPTVTATATAVTTARTKKDTSTPITATTIATITVTNRTDPSNSQPPSTSTHHKSSRKPSHKPKSTSTKDPNSTATIRPAVLAGLAGVSTSSRLAASFAGTGIGGGRSRVNAWRAHVRPGYADGGGGGGVMEATTTTTVVGEEAS